MFSKDSIMNLVGSSILKRELVGALTFAVLATMYSTFNKWNNDELDVRDKVSMTTLAYTTLAGAGFGAAAGLFCNTNNYVLGTSLLCGAVLTTLAFIAAQKTEEDIAKHSTCDEEDKAFYNSLIPSASQYAPVIFGLCAVAVPLVCNALSFSTGR